VNPITEGKLVPSKDAIAAFARWRKALIIYYGEKELQRIERNPLDLETISEFRAEKLAADPKFNNRIATQWLLERIAEYQKKHSQSGEK
jgi:hypothetical protein